MSRKKQKASADDGGDPNAWMATFADLVTLLITFFVLLLSMSNLDSRESQNTFGDAPEKLNVDAALRGGAPVLIEGEGENQKRGVMVGGHRPSTAHQPNGRPQGGPDKKVPLSPEQTQEMFEGISSQLQGVSAERIIEGRTGQGARRRFEQLVGLMNNPHFDQVFRMVLHKDRLRIQFASDLIFLPGRVRIREESLVVLRELSKLLKGKDILTRVIAEVPPEKDATPIARSDLYPSQWDLAIARSCNVVRYMTDSMAVPGAQLGCIAEPPMKGTENANSVTFELRVAP